MPSTTLLMCPRCGWQALCGPAQMLDWLRRVKMARRDVSPEPDVLAELLGAAAPRFACPGCGAVGLSAGAADDKDDEAWGIARKCEGCGKPIARERLEALPETVLCVDCQGRDDRGESAGPVEYCPRCGGVMTVRQSRRGVTRYVMVCAECGR